MPPTKDNKFSQIYWLGLVKKNTVDVAFLNLIGHLMSDPDRL